MPDFDFGSLNHGADELSRYANDMAMAIDTADETGDNSFSAYTVTSFAVASVDGKHVGTMSQGDDGVWTLAADNPDSVKLDTVDLIEAFVRDMESASLADFSNDERKQQVKRAVQMLRHVADDCTFGAVLKALGAPDEGDDNENAVAPPGNEPDSVKREELAALETEFEAAGGRGVELADRIDALRAEVAIEQAVAGMPEHPCIERSGTADAPWWVWIPPRGPQDFDADEWSILGPYGGTYWPTFDEAVEFMRRTTSDPAKLPADVAKRLDRFKQEHPDLMLDPTKEDIDEEDDDS